MKIKKDKKKQKSQQRPGVEEEELTFGALSDDDETPISQGRIDESLMGIIARRGTANAAARELVLENLKLRRRARLAEKELEEIEDLEEGAVVLTADEAKSWNIFKELNLKAEDLKGVIEEHGTLKKASSKQERSNIVSEAAEIMGWNNALLERLVTDDMSIKMQPVKQQDKTLKNEPFVQVKENGVEKLVHIADYAEANWKAILPALELESENTEDEEDQEAEQKAETRSGKKVAATGTAWVSQQTGKQDTSTGKKGKDTSGDYIDSYMKSKYPAPKQQGT